MFSLIVCTVNIREMVKFSHGSILGLVHTRRENEHAHLKIKYLLVLECREISLQQF